MRNENPNPIITPAPAQQQLAIALNGQAVEGAGTSLFDYTLRDQFAAQAMQALLTGRTVARLEKDPTINARMAGMSYAIADAMLAERMKQA